ncbi:hypothetical protein X773_33095 [Mesorhizobium sp. LSJC285A00]|nr:hypothetical protein X773_33095 [Mesorhizobium sp. LSJC285A00]
MNVGMTAARSAPRIVVANDDGKVASQLRDVTSNDNPMLGKEATKLIDESDPVGDQTLTNAMTAWIAS